MAAIILKKLLTETFRPTELSKMVLPDRIRRDFLDGPILHQNIILYSNCPGTGKTTLARILTANYDTLKLNGSAENGIDTIRNRVVQFASSVSLDNGKENIKAIYIDEADGLTDAAWDALRETIERYAGNVRFICTCNKIEKIPEPIRSRFKCIPVFPVDKNEEDEIFKGYCNRISLLLDNLNIKYQPETLSEFVKISFPDLRTVLNNIQALLAQGATELDASSFISIFDASDLFKLIVDEVSPVENYKFIMNNYGSCPEDALREISRSFIDFLKLNCPDKVDKIPYLIIVIAEYMNQLVTSSDKIIVLLACCFKLQTIIHS